MNRSIFEPKNKMDGYLITSVYLRLLAIGKNFSV